MIKVLTKCFLLMLWANVVVTTHMMAATAGDFNNIRKDIQILHCLICNGVNFRILSSSSMVHT